MRTPRGARPSGRFRVERRGMTSPADLAKPYENPQARDGFDVWGRQNPRRYKGPHDAPPESAFEKQMIVAADDNWEPRDLVWADARFATDIMREHSLFFTVLMPPELCAEERAEAQRFQKQYGKLHARIDSKGPPSAGEVKSYVRTLQQELQPLIDFKEDQHKAQVDGSLQSLVWPLFFDHTRREAVRWLGRMEDIAEGNVELERKEVLDFWCGIMDEHARFVAHLLDPDEYELITKAYNASDIFQALQHGATGPVRALVTQPADTVKSLVRNPELDAVESAAETILDFKTDAVRKIETAKIKSIISPILADHVRREAVKFLDELHRTKEA